MSTGLYSGASGLSFGTGLYKNRLGLFSGASGLITGTGPTPALSLYFLSGSTLDPRITFSRGTNATLIDSTGQLTFAPSNMLINSEGFGSTSWVKGGTTTVASNTVVAPDGTTTADSVTLPGASLIRQNATGIVGVNYSVSVWLRADAPQSVRLVSNTDTAVVVATTCSVTTAWQRFSLVRVMPAGATTVSLQLDVSGLTGGLTFYVWGAQLGAVTYETEPRAYNSTTPKNLLARTEEFDNATWVKNTSSITANVVADPNGNQTADKLVEDNTTGGHFFTQSYTYVAGVPYTYSIYLKAAERQYAQLVFINTSFGVNLVAGFDLVNGATVVSAGATSSITAVGNGWYRCSITATATASAGSNLQMRMTNSLTTTTGSYAGDGTSGLYVWGAQLSDSASLDAYVYNPVAAIVSAAYYGPRFDYNPTTLAPLGLLIEEARTNLLLNSQTLSTQNVTTTAQAYTLSFYGTGTVTLSGTSTAGPLVGTGAFPNRVSLTFTPTAGALTLTVTGTVSNAQLEAGGFATSYIFTGGASVTRSADVATMVGNNFSNWYNQTTGTLAVSFDASANANATYVSASNGSIVQNSIHIDNDSGNMRAVYYSGSAEVAALVLGAIGTAGTANKIATAYAVNDFAASRNGGTVATDTSGALPVSLTQLNIGVDDRLSAIYYTSNHIKAITYYNTRLSDAQLQAIST